MMGVGLGDMLVSWYEILDIGLNRKFRSVLKKQ